MYRTEVCNASYFLSFTPSYHYLSLHSPSHDIYYPWNEGLYIVAEGGPPRYATVEYFFRAQAGVVISREMGDTATASATDIAKIIVYCYC